ncbi:MAG: manganese efflux pump MntP family protein [Oscillospiraceae bacterium]
MDIITLLFVALGLSMDAFAVSVSNSMCFANLKRKQALITSFSFGVFQALMPVLGYIAGRGFSDFVSKIDHWIALVLLCFIGGKMLYDGIQELRSAQACETGAKFTYKLMLVQAIATSIDALAVGVSFAALDVNIFYAAFFIGIITFACCVIGHLIGKKAGSLLGKVAQILGGGILVFIGLKIFIEHMLG